MAISIVNLVIPKTGDGPIVDVSTMVGLKTVTVSGGFTGVYTLLASHDDVNFDPIVSFSYNGGSARITLCPPRGLGSLETSASFRIPRSVVT